MIVSASALNGGKRMALAVIGLCVLTLFPAGARAVGSLSGESYDLPSRQQLHRVLTFSDYNTRVVVIGTMLLGVASGIVGTFMLLRKRALISDAISHATLPGIALAFIVVTVMGGDGKSLPMLLAAAVVAAVVGVGCVLAIRNLTRLKEDAALGIVLSVFFGLGVALLGVIQKMSTGNAAGLESFIYGKTASMLMLDAKLIAIIGAIAVALCLLMLKEFSLVCFDQSYAATQGWPVVMLDVVMMTLVVAVTVVGLQAVGLILVVALLIIPPAAARFWTQRLNRSLIIAALFGGLSGLIGAVISALFSDLPSGAIIVVVASVLFVISLLFGVRRGAVRRVIEHHLLRRRVGRQHLLRAMYEWYEPKLPGGKATNEAPMTWSDLMTKRSWTAGQLRRLLRALQWRNLVTKGRDNTWLLTDSGLTEAARVTRNHRLWEMYLITHADIAPSHVDRDADTVEHVLGRDLVAKLEALIEAGRGRPDVPPSPHSVGATT